MRTFVLLAAAGLCSWSVPLSADPAPAATAAANPADDATKFLTMIIDKFNGGDVKGWVAAQEDNTMIVDEFVHQRRTGAAHAHTAPELEAWLNALQRQNTPMITSRSGRAQLEAWLDAVAPLTSVS